MQEHLNLIREGREALTAWRAANPTAILDLSDTDFNDPFILLPSDLRRTDLSRCLFQKGFVVDRVFDEATLDQADISDCHFSNCSFKQARGKGVKASKASFHDCDFESSRLSHNSDSDRLVCAGLGMGGNILTHSAWIHFDASQNSDFSDCSFMKCRLQAAILLCANMSGCQFWDCEMAFINLEGSFIRSSQFNRCSLSKAQLSRCDLAGSVILGCDLSAARIVDADLSDARIAPAVMQTSHNVRVSPGKGIVGVESMREHKFPCSLRDALIECTDLTRAEILETDLTGAQIKDCSIYGLSAWGNDTTNSVQHNLDIGHEPGLGITVDDLEIGQFIYLMTQSDKLRGIIDSIVSKVVLLLGRFDTQGKQVLSELRVALREKGFVPVVFDFDCPQQRGLLETIGLIARMSRFIIADLSNPRSVPHELQSLIPDCPSIPFQPIISAAEREYGMFKSLQVYPWVMPLVRYEAETDFALLIDGVLADIENKARN